MLKHTLLLIVLFFAGTAFGLEKLTTVCPELYSADIQAGRHLPMWKSEEPDWGNNPKRVLWQLNYGVRKNNIDSSLIIESTRITENITLDKGWIVRQANIRYIEPSLVSVTGHEIATMTFDEKNSRYTFEMFKEGKRTDRKEVSIDSNTVFVDCMPFLLESMLNRGHTNSFNCDMLMRMGLKVNIDVVLKTATNFQELHPQFQFPAFFLQYFSKPNTEYYVYEMGVAGVLSALYPHKFCFVFSKTRKPEYIAYYGGEPKKEASFQVKWNH